MDISYIGYSHNGIGNQFCSLQLFAGLLGHFKDKNINLVWDLPYNNMQDPQSESRNEVNTYKIDKHLDNSRNGSIFDLVDFNYDNYTLHPNDHYIKNRSKIQLFNLQRSYISESQNPDFMGEQIKLSEDKHNILNMTLIWYSKFFHNRSRDVDLNLKKFKFKDEYYQIANNIAKYFGEYNGTQARLMFDHHQYYKFSEQSFNNGLNKFDNPNLPILCSVDNFNHKYIQKNKDRLILVEDIILNDFIDDFKQLKFQNRISIAIISALVMTMAKDFVGTPYSTFSTMIFQLRNNLIDEKWKYYPSNKDIFDNYDTNTVPYSWSNFNSMISWERDWKESKLNV